MALGDCHFQRIATKRECAVNLVTEGLMKAPTLQLLVVILQGKTPFYGRYFLTFLSRTFEVYDHVTWLFTVLIYVKSLW